MSIPIIAAFSGLVRCSARSNRKDLRRPARLRVSTRLATPRSQPRGKRSSISARHGDLRLEAISYPKGMPTKRTRRQRSSGRRRIRLSKASCAQFRVFWTRLFGFFFGPPAVFAAEHLNYEGWIFLRISLDSLVRIETFQWVTRHEASKSSSPRFCSWRSQRHNGSLRSRPVRKRRIVHEASLTSISDFLQ